MNPISIADNYAVCAQINQEDVAQLKQQGFVAIVNNRPDYEEPGQPLASEIEQAAAEQQLPYIWLPMQGPNMTMQQIEQLDAFITDNPGKILAFCRSGNRSNILYNVWLQNKA